MYKQVLFFWMMREPAHIAFVILHLELCLHSHSFHAAHSSWTGREWSLCLGPSPGKMPAPAYADPGFLVELGLRPLAALCAWGGPRRCPTKSEPDMGSLGQGSWRHIRGETRFYSGQLWSAWLDGVPGQTPRAPAPRTGSCRVNCILLFCLDPSC